MPIIKCPGCGQNTSTMALTCPHCNTKIRGYIHSCPHCGTWAFYTDTKCPCCGGDMSVTVEEAARPTVSARPSAALRPSVRQAKGITVRPCPIAPPKEPGKKKGHGCLKAFFRILLVALCLSVAAYGAYRYYLEHQARLLVVREDLARRIAEDEEQNALKLQQARQDSAFWSQTLKTKTIEAARDYISTYPEGIFIDEAYLLIEELQRRSVGAAEQKHIKGVVENRLAQIREQFIKNGKRGAKDVRYSIVEPLIVSRKYINRDSFLYIVDGTVEKQVLPNGKGEAEKTSLDLHMTLDKQKNILESDLNTRDKR